jgi:hypothetical protein
MVKSAVESEGEYKQMAEELKKSSDLLSFEIKNLQNNVYDLE